MGMASLPFYCLLGLLLTAVKKIFAVKVGTFIDPAHLPCQPACFVSLPALSACLLCQPASLVLVS
jgi:hypothetical protein